LLGISYLPTIGIIVSVYPGLCTQIGIRAYQFRYNIYIQRKYTFSHVIVFEFWKKKLLCRMPLIC